MSGEIYKYRHNVTLGERLDKTAFPVRLGRQGDYLTPQLPRGSLTGWCCLVVVSSGVATGSQALSVMAIPQSRLAWIEKLAHFTLCWCIYPYERRTPSRRTPNDHGGAGPLLIRDGESPSRFEQD